MDLINREINTVLTSILDAEEWQSGSSLRITIFEECQMFRRVFDTYISLTS